MFLPIFITLLLACCGGLQLAAAQGSCYDNTVSTDPAAQKINATASSLYAVATTYVGSWTSCFSIPMSGYAVFGGNKVAFSGVRVSPGVCSCVAHCEPESIHWSDSHTIHIHNSLFAGNIYSAGTSNVSSSTSISTTQINAWLLNVISKFGYTGTSVPSTMSTGSFKSCTNSSGDTLLCNANSGEISEMFCVNLDNYQSAQRASSTTWTVSDACR